MTKKFLQFYFACLLALIIPVSQANSTLQIQERINKVLKQYNLSGNVGILVQSLTSQEIIYQKNAKQLFMPASILKILPAIAALSFLGSDYHFQTKVLTKNTNIDRGIINNDIYFYFDGDPSLSLQDFDSLIKMLAASGLKTINGNLYIDDTTFDGSLLGAGWVWEDLNFCYAAPISSIIIDKNCFTLKLHPSKYPEKPAILTNTATYVSITNGVVSKNLETNNGNCPLNLHASSDNNYYLSGCLKTNAEPINLSFAIKNVRLYARNLLLEKLQENHIKLTGRVEFRKIPSNISLGILAEHQSKSLAELVKTMLKESDNTIADAIYKKLGAMFFNKQASWQDGAKAIKHILESKTNKVFEKLYMDDGSGLSRYNLVTPEIMVTALNYAYYNKKINQFFIDSLPHAGINGTLKNRVLHLKNKVYAKTGNMGNTTSLAGYIKTKNQDMLSFVIIINSFLDSPKKYHKLQDDICTILASS